jgi:hypothetical protein
MGAAADRSPVSTVVLCNTTPFLSFAKIMALQKIVKIVGCDVDVDYLFEPDVNPSSYMLPSMEGYLSLSRRQLKTYMRSKERNKKHKRKSCKKYVRIDWESFLENNVMPLMESQGIRMKLSCFNSLLSLIREDLESAVNAIGAFGLLDAVVVVGMFVAIDAVGLLDAVGTVGLLDAIVEVGMFEAVGDVVMVEAVGELGCLMNPSDSMTVLFAVYLYLQRNCQVHDELLGWTSCVDGGKRPVRRNISTRRQMVQTPRQAAQLYFSLCRLPSM